MIFFFFLDEMKFKSKKIIFEQIFSEKILKILKIKTMLIKMYKIFN